MPDLVGKLIRGYQIREQIAAGGFGAIHRATQRSVGREVAIKVILPEFASQPEFIRQFETEARLIARLEHPHIVPLYDFWREPEGAYLIMRWFPAGSLRAELEGGAVALEDALRWVGQIAAALATAHQQGVIHRDLKPDNILIDAERNAYLTDFGIAKVLESSSDLTLKGFLPGSPAYAAPEQALAEPVTIQTDIYSLGVVLYELLTGEHPFPNHSPVQQIAKHLNEPLPRLAERAPGLPLGFDDVIQQATAKSPGERYDSVGAFRAALQEAAGSSTTPAARTLVNPYKGLLAFQEADAGDFYGREALVEQLLTELSPSKELYRFLAVVGPSGSGKSSLVKAGLIPAIKRGALHGSQNWYVLAMQPGMRPLEELEIGLLGIAAERVTGLRDHLESDERGLLRAARLALPTDDAELLLVIDQFEEVFTLVEDERRSRHLMNLLHAAATDPHSRVRVVITLRADFYDRPLMYRPFGELVSNRHVSVVPLSSEELTKAIVSPAQAAGVTVASDLIAEIVADVIEQPGALPLLQYAMTELFDRQEQGSIERSEYEAIGGVFGALGKRSEAVYAALNPAGQEIARQLFLRLVALGEGTEDTRRRVARLEITSLWEDPAAAEAVVEAFGASRLLSFDHDPVSRDPTVEVAHEALISGWDRLRRWLDQSRADVRLQRLLAGAAHEWTASDRDPSFLLRGTRLDQFEAWSAETELALTQGERDFLDASLADRRARRAAEAERLAKRADLERRSRNFLRALVGVMAAATVIGLTLAGSARQAQSEAEAVARSRSTAQAQADLQRLRAEEEVDAHATQRAIAEIESARAEEQARNSFARELAAASIANLGADAQLALLLALQSVEQTRAVEAIVLPEAEDALHRAVQANAPRLIRTYETGLHGLRRVDLDPTGSHFVVYGDPLGNPSARDSSGLGLPYWRTRGTTEIWDARSGERKLVVPGLLAHDRWLDERLLAIADQVENNTLRLNVWDVLDQRQLATHLIGPVVGGESHWDSSDLYALDLTPDLRLMSLSILWGSEPIRIVWDLEAGSEVLRLEYSGPGGSLRTFSALSFSPDGGQLAGGTRLGQVEVSQLPGGETTFTEPMGLGYIREVEYSPDGSILATIKSCTGSPECRAEDIQLWKMGAEGPIVERIAVRGPLSSVSFSPDGSLLASTHIDHSARVWSVQSRTELFNFQVPGERLMDAEFSADGSLLIGASQQGNVHLWDIRPEFGYEQQILPRDAEHFAPGAVTIALSPEETELATAHSDGSLNLWDLKTGELIFSQSATSDGLVQVSFLPSSFHLATLSRGGVLQIWDSFDGALKRTILDFFGCCFAIDPSGETIAVSNTPRTVEHLNLVALVEEGVESRSAATELLCGLPGDVPTQTGFDRGFSAEMLGVAFAPAGNMLAVACEGGRVQFFESESGERLDILESPRSTPLEIVFDGSGALFATAGSDGRIQVVDTASGDLLHAMHGHAGAVTAVAFSHDGRSLASTSQDGTVRLWDVSSGREVLSLFVTARGATDVEFSPDDKRLYVSGSDGAVRVYLLDMEELIELAKARLFRSMSQAECQRYLHQPMCPDEEAE